MRARGGAPAPYWPGGKKVAVMVTAAVELWTDGHWPVYAPMAAAWPLPGAHDALSVGWSQYGVTTGIWRLLDILERRAVTATVGVNGLVAERFPDVVLAVDQAGHEVAAHSYAQDVLPAQLGPDEERANITRSTELLRSVTGRRPTGWMSPRATGTSHTAELLADAGYVWCGDFNDRELPYVVDTEHGPLVAIMHADVSDVRAAAAGPQSYRDAYRDLLDYALTSPYPEVVNVLVHAHVGGRPAVANMFDQILASLEAVRDDIWLATRQQMAQYVLSQAAHPDKNPALR